MKIIFKNSSILYRRRSPPPRKKKQQKHIENNEHMNISKNMKHHISKITYTVPQAFFPKQDAQTILNAMNISKKHANTYLNT